MLRKIVKLPINLLFSIFVSANYFEKKDDKRLSFLRQIYNFRVTNRSKLLSSSPHTTQHFCTNTHLHNSTVCLSFFLSLSKTFYWLFFALLYIQISLSISFSIYLSVCLHFSPIDFVCSWEERGARVWMDLCQLEGCALFGKYFADKRETSSGRCQKRAGWYDTYGKENCHVICWWPQRN